MKATKFAGKLGLFLIGTIPGSVRVIEETTRSIAPEFSLSVDSSSLGSLSLGDSNAHSHVLEKLKSAFESTSVVLDKAEIALAETKARELADSAGIDYDIALSGLKASMLAAKNKVAP